tara:strand:- start:201 stop:683 length:483 start_codon:yes stop_codon:yes gene_type:complete
MSSLKASPTDAIIFQMASAISQEHPDISIPTAISIAAKIMPIAAAQRTTAVRKNTKPKKPRSKNAYMFYLDSVRATIKQELIPADNPEAKIRVSEITKIAGARWKQLSPAQKAPFEKQALDAKNALAQSLLESNPTTSAPSSPTSTNSNDIFADDNNDDS